MNRKRIGVCALLSAALLFAATEPVLAQSSINEKLISSLNQKLLFIAVPFTVLVEGILFYTVWKFKDNDDANPTRENRRLEITWTLATAVILLFVGLGSFVVLANPAISLVPDAAQGQQPQAQQEIQPAVTMNKSGAVAPPSDSNVLEVEAVGSQWSWTFNYPEANVSTSGTMVLPANTSIYLHTTSTDVIHSVHIPALGIKQDSFPSQYNTVKTNVTETGTYQLYCAEFCGTGHSRMLANVTVVSQEQYQSWLNQQQSSGSSSSSANSSGNSSANSSAMAPVSVKPA
jgi:cytochrome c oxidase subunit 2